VKSTYPFLDAHINFTNQLTMERKQLARVLTFYMHKSHICDSWIGHLHVCQCKTQCKCHNVTYCDA